MYIVYIFVAQFFWNNKCYFDSLLGVGTSRKCGTLFKEILTFQRKIAANLVRFLKSNIYKNFLICYDTLTPGRKT